MTRAGKSRKVLVGSDAIRALQIAIDAQDDQKERGAQLFTAGGALAGTDLKTEFDWVLFNAAYRLTHGNKV